MWVTNPIWRDLLIYLHHRHVKLQHIQILQMLIINNLPLEHIVVFDKDPWVGAALVTPQHIVHRLWNKSATRKWCHQSGNQLFICKAEDTTQDHALTLLECYRMAARGKGSKSGKWRKRKDLQVQIELAKGIKVLVTDNVETNFNITNGTQGEIIYSILHPDEPLTGEGLIVHLKYLPSYLLVKLSHIHTSQLDGLDEAIIPVEPAMITMYQSTMARLSCIPFNTDNTLSLLPTHSQTTILKDKHYHMSSLTLCCLLQKHWLCSTCMSHYDEALGNAGYSGLQNLYNVLHFCKDVLLIS